jgi:hypothetical protein
VRVDNDRGILDVERSFADGVLGDDRNATSEGDDCGSKRKFVHRLYVGTILYDPASDNNVVVFR